MIWSIIISALHLSRISTKSSYSFASSLRLLVLCCFICACSLPVLGQPHESNPSAQINLLWWGTLLHLHSSKADSPVLLLPSHSPPNLHDEPSYFPIFHSFPFLFQTCALHAFSCCVPCTSRTRGLQGEHQQWTCPQAAARGGLSRPLCPGRLAWTLAAVWTDQGQLCCGQPAQYRPIRISPGEVGLFLSVCLCWPPFVIGSIRKARRNDTPQPTTSQTPGDLMMGPSQIVILPPFIDFKARYNPHPFSCLCQPEGNRASSLAHTNAMMLARVFSDSQSPGLYVSPLWRR